MEELYYIYAIRSLKDGRIYVGMTIDVGKRLREHNYEHTRSTKSYMPWELIFVKEVIGRAQARQLEKYYKGGSGKEFLKTLNLANGPVVQRIE